MPQKASTVNEFPYDASKICTALHGKMTNGVCDGIPAKYEGSYDKDLSNIVGLITFKQTKRFTTAEHPKGKSQYIGIVYPFRGDTSKEPVPDIYSIRFLPISEKTAKQWQVAESDGMMNVYVPTSFADHLKITVPNYAHNGGEGVTEYLNIFNRNNMPFRSGYA